MNKLIESARKLIGEDGDCSCISCDNCPLNYKVEGIKDCNEIFNSWWFNTDKSNEVVESCKQYLEAQK